MIEYLLGALPAVLLAISLFLGCYPGEKLIVRLSRRSRPRIGSSIAPASSRNPRPRAIAEALRMLAASRPLRGPPVLSLAHR